MTHDTHEIEYAGETLVFRVESEKDFDAGLPWECEDCHGEVTAFLSRAKRPGELILSNCSRSGQKRFYDFAGAVKKARKEGWDADGKTPGEKAHNAALADFAHLRKWCADEWEYRFVKVTLLDSEGEPVDEIYDCLGGIYSENEGEDIRRLCDDLAGRAHDFLFPAGGDLENAA